VLRFLRSRLLCFAPWKCLRLGCGWNAAFVFRCSLGYRSGLGAFMKNRSTTIAKHVLSLIEERLHYWT